MSQKKEDFTPYTLYSHTRSYTRDCHLFYCGSPFFLSFKHGIQQVAGPVIANALSTCPLNAFNSLEFVISNLFISCLLLNVPAFLKHSPQRVLCLSDGLNFPFSVKILSQFYLDGWGFFYCYYFLFLIIYKFIFLGLVLFIVSDMYILWGGFL